MRLFWYEFLKIARIPMIWLYFFGCVLYNYSELTSGIGYFVDKDYLAYTNTIIKEIGWELGEDFDIALKNTPDHPYKARLQEETKGLDDYFQNIDIDQLGQVMIDFSGTEESDSSFFADRLEDNFEKLEHQVNSIEAVSLLAGTQSQWIYDMIFKQLFPCIMLQMSILAVIIMLFLTDYEENEKTHLLIYSTKKGREVQGSKLMTGCMIAMIFHFFLCILTFSAFFLQYDLSGVGNATMDTPFLTLTVHMIAFPFITWHSITFFEYFLWIFLLSAVFVLIYTGVSWVIGLFSQNMYLAFGICFVGILAQFLIYFQWLNQYFLFGRYFMECNPLILSLRLNSWLTYMGYSALIPYQETWGILVFFIMSTLVISTTYKLFRRKDILS